MNARPPWALLQGDALDLLPELRAASIDAVVTDPPYGIGLRGEPWDRQPGWGAGTERFERWTTGWAAECLRVMKPGAHLIAFGAPRTSHRLTAGIEEAGFEIRDQLCWLFGTGVPKAPLVGGRSTTLRPGYEPILLARKPLVGTASTNESLHGTGRLGIDEARVCDERAKGNPRWPCNVTLTHARRCRGAQCVDTCPIAILDRSKPALRPSRFYYCAKASRRERDVGCERLPARVGPVYRTARPSHPRHNTHPTVKPLELMRWLIRLTVPPCGHVLDLFAGSGSTGVAALLEARVFTGIEQDVEYARVARARLRHAERVANGEIQRRPAA